MKANSLQAPTQSHQRLALAFIEFLNKSRKDGTLSEDDGESIEIASSCIADAFHVDPSDEAAIEDAIGRQSLLSIYGIFEKAKNNTGPEQKKEPTASSAANSTSKPSGPTPESEKLKGQGNAALARKDYPSAISLYSQALEINPGNVIYLSNRAAAFSASGDHDKAVTDARAAVESDSTYVKGWSRLGLGLFALGDAKGAVDAYQKGIDAEGNGGSDAMRRALETAKKKLQESEPSETNVPETSRESPSSGMPDLSSLASMLGGGGGSGGGGMPDLSSIMNNPMLSGIAQNLMSNPEMMNSLMNNPRLRQLAENFGRGGSGGGMPDLNSLMSDPNIANM